TASVAVTSGTGLTKSGTGTLRLSVAYFYCVATTFLGGTLTIGAYNTIAAASGLTIGLITASVSQGNTGNLTLASFNETFASISVISKSSAQNTITIGSGKTLSVTGSAGV